MLPGLCWLQYACVGKDALHPAPLAAGAGVHVVCEEVPNLQACLPSPRAIMQGAWEACAACTQAKLQINAGRRQESG